MANKANFSEIGNTGLQNYSGIIRDDFLKEFTGKEAYKRFNEMRLNSPIIASGLSAIEYIIRKMSWNFSETDEGDERAVLLEDARNAMTMSWNDHISEALSFIWAGFYIGEKVYQRDERNRILWKKFATRRQDTVYRWEMDKEGGVQGIVQMAAPVYEVTPIPIEKLLIYRTRLEGGNPEGRSLLRPAWIPYYYTKNLQQIEAIGFERDLNGLPVIKLPSGADTAETTTSDLGKAQQMVRNLRNDEQAGVTLPFEWDLVLLSGAGKGFDALSSAIKRYESRTAMVFFTQSLLLGQDGVGSLALSSDMKNFLITFADSIADIIAETFSKYAIPDLLRLNGYKNDPPIKLEHTPAGDIDIQQWAESLSKIFSTLSMTPDDEVWARQILGLPERTAEDIEADNEEKKKKQDEIVGAIKNKVDEKEEKPLKTDELRAEYYSVAPNNAERMKMERKWQKAIENVLDKQKRKVLKAAKELQR